MSNGSLWAASRGALVALACLSATAAHAGSISSSTTVTIPTDFSSSSSTLGPQSVNIGFSNPSTASRPMIFRLGITGAEFVTTTAPTITLTGSTTFDAAAICSVSILLDAVSVQCTPTGGASITGVTIAALNYKNATALNVVGGSIKLSCGLSAASVGTFEEVSSTAVVTRTTTSSGSTATSNVTLRQGAVYSTTQSSAQSLVRFYNGGKAAGTVTVTLSDYATGEKLTTWTSPSIAPGAARQYPISTLESEGTPASFTKPDYYSLGVAPTFAGTFQHVLYRPSDGVLTNLSTCDSGITAAASRVVNVHSSRLAANGFPSTVVIYNTGTAAAIANVAVNDARDGTSLGTYSTTASPATGDLVLAVSNIETAAKVTPTSDQLHLVISVQSAFTGYLQHRVNNQQAAVITDMSTVCTFSTSTTTSPTPSTPSDRR